MSRENYVRWTLDMERRLIRLRKEGWSSAWIAEAMGVTRSAIQNRSELLLRRGDTQPVKKGVKGHPDPVETFWARVDRSAGPEACWPWTSSVAHFGHGKVQFKVPGFPRTVHAHRVAFALTGGDLSLGAVVRHRCDNPPCCNPAHLEIGTRADNVRDQVQRGRTTLGRKRKPRARQPQSAIEELRG